MSGVAHKSKVYYIRDEDNRPLVTRHLRAIKYNGIAEWSVGTAICSASEVSPSKKDLPELGVRGGLTIASDRSAKALREGRSFGPIKRKEAIAVLKEVGADHLKGTYKCAYKPELSEFEKSLIGIPWN